MGCRLSDTMHYVYIVECSDNSFYTGYTTDVERRIEEHNAGRGAKYTRSRRPVRLIYSESFPTKSEALKRELAIKALSEQEKEELIAR